MNKVNEPCPSSEEVASASLPSLSSSFFSVPHNPLFIWRSQYSLNKLYIQALSAWPICLSPTRQGTHKALGHPLSWMIAVMKSWKCICLLPFIILCWLSTAQASGTVLDRGDTETVRCEPSIWAVKGQEKKKVNWAREMRERNIRWQSQRSPWKTSPNLTASPSITR